MQKLCNILIGSSLVNSACSLKQCNMGLLPDTWNCGLCMCRECQDHFPPPLISDPDMHHDTCATHVPWCMSGSLTGGFLWSRWRGKRYEHSRRMRMRNPQFYVSGKRPMGFVFQRLLSLQHPLPAVVSQGMPVPLLCPWPVRKPWVPKWGFRLVVKPLGHMWRHILDVNYGMNLTDMCSIRLPSVDR